MRIALILLACLLSSLCFAAPEESTGAEVADFRAEAEQGRAGAMSSLGWCYERGVGVEKDVKEAVRWYKAAAEQGHKGGQYNLGRCYERGMVVEKDLKEAMRWYKKAAKQGHQPAKTKLEEMGISTLD